CYLFNHKALPLLADFMEKLDVDVIGKGLDLENNGVDNIELIKVNEAIRSTRIEQIGKKLRTYMSTMKPA
ncbi:MAG: ketol-acid reductoisomerase, partial [Desulfobacula sp.]|nr:ketol-acid reductoisomerase [Desulfobacula sp.]